MTDEPEETPIEEEPVLDFDTLMGPITSGNVCLLCQRKFENAEKLERHVTLSDLHKTNLKKKTQEINQKLQQQNPPKPQQKRKTAPTQHNTNQKNKTQRTEQKSSPHQPQMQQPPPLFDPFQMNNTPQGAPAPEWQTGAAAKMMALMGWKGGGLGAKGTGIVEPVKVHIQEQGAGLGTAKPNTTSEEDAEQAFKQMMKERRWGKS